MILKDVLWTHKNSALFKSEKIIFLQTHLFFKIQAKYVHFQYTQGINYLLSAIVFHTQNVHSCLKILKFLFKHLEFEKLFCFKQFPLFENCFRKLLMEHSKEFYNFFKRNDLLDFKIMLIDWFFPLGFSKIPLMNSAIFLKSLVKNGWFFFYRFLLVFYERFYEKYKGHI